MGSAGCFCPALLTRSEAASEQMAAVAPESSLGRPSQARPFVRAALRLSDAVAEADFH